MNKKDAKQILNKQLLVFENMPYDELVRFIDKTETVERVWENKKKYLMEFNFHWDSEPNGDIRIIGSIDDGSFFRFILPISSGTLVPVKI